MRWTEEHLAMHQRRHGVPSHAPNTADVSRPPFLPLDDVVLDLPPPISANKTRRIDWSASKRLKKWKAEADQHVLAAKCRAEHPLKLSRIARFELWITLSDSLVRIDADNALKNLIDYLRRIELIEDDAKKNMRGVHVVFGIAPQGCRVVVRPICEQLCTKCRRANACTTATRCWRSGHERDGGEGGEGAV